MVIQCVYRCWYLPYLFLETVVVLSTRVHVVATFSACIASWNASPNCFPCHEPVLLAVARRDLVDDGSACFGTVHNSTMYIYPFPGSSVRVDLIARLSVRHNTIIDSSLRLVTINHSSAGLDGVVASSSPRDTHAGSSVQLDAAASFSVSPDIVPDSFALPDNVLDSSSTFNFSAHYSAFNRAVNVTSLQVDTIVAIVS
jgi:hypothetical protein